MTTPDAGSRLAYLGPDGTFTHEAALRWAQAPGAHGIGLEAVRTVAEVYDGVESGAFTHGVVAIESSVEGYVVPSLDAIVSAENVVAVDETFVEIAFDAFARPGATEQVTQVTSHPHGLAQCQSFVTGRDLLAVPAASNAAACRDVQAGQLALGPRICGELYGLQTVARGVEDFHGARTRFLLVTSRDVAARARPAALDGDAWRTMLAITPHATGPGVLARITQAFGALGVNLSSLITRPVKALEGRYVFIVTIDGAPWDTGVRGVLEGLLAAGDSLKTLGVLPARGELDGTVDAHRVPSGSVRVDASDAVLDRGLLWSPAVTDGVVGS
ncbi:prephenate dehydratase [Sanguibacter antarcticus]|uniref:Prephenate dehydratase n=1 Tax=Sanguibacter antarcticus TaxID=372484 RepID=A0A2A9E4H9_9MICO|nr:prephenate dehydratase domain-containing protein [Sanguibacter antarcticus]PFG33754.1 prephenate dehydratase [Sanguibacter antarcticus]